MSKGIYRIINTYNNRELAIYPSEDVEQSVADFDNGSVRSRYFARHKYKESLKAEIVERTDSLAERYAFYAWPKLSRLSYSTECMSMSLDKRFSKTVRNSVDWLLETFEKPRYSFELFIIDGELKADVFDNGRRFERYGFKDKKGEPSSRGFICEEPRIEL